jgi:hypothetical protein
VALSELAIDYSGAVMAHRHRQQAKRDRQADIAERLRYASIAQELQRL